MAAIEICANSCLPELVYENLYSYSWLNAALLTVPCATVYADIDVGCASDAQCKLSASSTSSSVLASTSSSSLLDSTATGSALHEPMDEEDDNGANIPDSSDTSTSLDRVHVFLFCLVCLHL